MILCFSQFRSRCTRWPSCIFSIILHFGAVHWLLENFGKDLDNMKMDIVLALVSMSLNFGYENIQGHSNSLDSSTIWERICKHKLPVVEPRQSSLFPTAIEVHHTIFVTFLLSILFLYLTQICWASTGLYGQVEEQINIWGCVFCRLSWKSRSLILKCFFSS